MDWHDPDDDRNVEWIIGACPEGIRCVNVERGEQKAMMPVPETNSKLIDFAISKKGNSINALCLNGNSL